MVVVLSDGARLFTCLVAVLAAFRTDYVGRVESAASLDHPFRVRYVGQCKRIPSSVIGPKMFGDNGFHIRISGNPDKYAPGETYTVTLQGFRNEKYMQKFTEFMLVVEPLEIRNDILARQDVGNFLLYGDSSAMFSEVCPNAIVQTSAIGKSEVQVMWQAPAVRSGCIVFKATVVENRDRWYMDDGNLTKLLCEQEQENEDEQPEVLENCCACDEAKYEISFEGVWSRHTHPKDFPDDLWNTHFSNILGASHSGDFRMWEYGGFASDGVREMAEQGTTKKLEAEMKENSTKIRTIIKARGLSHPNFNAKTFAVFRVDRHHHLMSFLTTLFPSPDWIVGVSALELCVKNCTWLTEKSMNLYPWDAGTDDGLTYKSANSPTMPRERIHRITASNPNTEASPFYDPTGTPMKPVAKMTVTRQRLYEKLCDESGSSATFPTNEGEGYENGRPECAVTEWSEVTPCSVTCGRGVTTRRRYYYHPQKAEMMNCQTKVLENKICNVPCHRNVNCMTTSWGAWSECSVTCDNGIRTRSRKYIDIKAHKLCTTELLEKEMCTSEQLCNVPDPIDPKCAVTHWSEWSPCTATCGNGMKARTRLYLNSSSLKTCNTEVIQKVSCMAEKPDCSIDLSKAVEICMKPKDVGPCRGYFPRWYYEPDRKTCVQFVYGGCRGNGNNFERYTECSKMCEDKMKEDVQLLPPGSNIESPQYPIVPQGGRTASFIEGNSPFPAPITTLTSLLTVGDLTRDKSIVDCEVTQWSDWSLCSSTCGSGRRERRRMIKLNPENGGKPCPQKLVQRRKCKNNPPCHDRIMGDVPIDCILNPWSEWSVCSKTCGHGGTQQRERTVRYPSKYDNTCRPKVERKFCILPPCPFY